METDLETDPEDDCVLNKLCDTILLSEIESHAVCDTVWLEDSRLLPETDCEGESDKEGSDDRLEATDTESVPVALAEYDPSSV